VQSHERMRKAEINENLSGFEREDNPTILSKDNSFCLRTRNTLELFHFLSMAEAIPLFCL
jgi:hypothetical protein